MIYDSIGSSDLYGAESRAQAEYTLERMEAIPCLYFHLSAAPVDLEHYEQSRMFRVEHRRRKGTIPDRAKLLALLEEQGACEG